MGRDALTYCEKNNLVCSATITGFCVCEEDEGEKNK